MSQNRRLGVQRLTQSNLRDTVAKLRGTPEAAKSVISAAQTVVRDVIARGDEAVIKYTQRFDQVKVEARELRVTESEIEDAYGSVDEDQVQAVKAVKRRVENTERKIIQRIQGPIHEGPGLRVTSEVRAIESVGCYVPGGQAAYPSSLIMTVTPAKVAGVQRVIVCSPPSSSGTLSPLLLVAADVCGADELYRVGGIQAVAAMAYGTETIPPVRKIVGPGNQYVTEAKKIVSGVVGVDSPAGPTEILVVADSTADPTLIARDLIAQAEHGETTICGLVTDSEGLAENVSLELASIIETADRASLVRKALLENGFILKCDDLSLAVDFANSFAPEHLEIVTEEPDKIAEKITSSGLILLGSYTPAAATDYAVGTNHVLPTSGYAKTYSGLSVVDFVRRVNTVRCSKEKLNTLRKTITVLARAEGLPNHAISVEERFK